MNESPSPELKPFSKLVREWRERQGLSMREASDRVGCDPSTWSKWESGQEPSGVARVAVEREMANSRKN